ncbi:MAG: hypothetical protein HKO63_08605 [Acidimicrobiia bacterium]|nr:hypothetical protein [Acidimicrobiia bacterium]NNL98249.1 hypothetical protein [Acidimicrobiia bacterium]
MDRWFSRRVVTRMPQFLAGIGLLGFGVALMDAGRLGFGPWSVLAEGVSIQSGIALGTADILIGVPVLFGWLIVRERPGLGTVINVFGVGLAINAGIAVLPRPDLVITRGAFTTAGVIAVGVGSALYLSADLGPGPRDGLMTGLHRRSGWSIRRVRTILEITVLIIGFALGGTIGYGTVLNALAIGFVIQSSLRVFDREGRIMQQPTRA